MILISFVRYFCTCPFHVGKGPHGHNWQPCWFIEGWQRLKRPPSGSRERHTQREMSQTQVPPWSQERPTQGEMSEDQVAAIWVPRETNSKRDVRGPSGSHLGPKRNQLKERCQKLKWQPSGSRERQTQREMSGAQVAAILVTRETYSRRDVRGSSGSHLGPERDQLREREMSEAQVAAILVPREISSGRCQRLKWQLSWSRERPAR